VRLSCIHRLPCGTFSAAQLPDKLLSLDASTATFVATTIFRLMKTAYCKDEVVMRGRKVITTGDNDDLARFKSGCRFREESHEENRLFWKESFQIL